MNSYNDNLRSTILASLNEQELSTESSKATRDAAALTMFYAEGAKITAAQRLSIADDTYKRKNDVNTEAVSNSNISTNMLNAAKQENVLTAQSVTNAAVSAGNVQIAATAITKLASDVGSIFNIVQAANLKSEIYKQAKNANYFIKETAYNAEALSKRAMDASASTAKISATTVEDLATVTDASIKEIESIAATELEQLSAIVDADNEALAEASIAEKAAEGVLEEAIESYNAIYTAYDFSNESLNLELSVTAVSAVEFNVTFNQILAPFEPEHLKASKKSTDEDEDAYDSDNNGEKGKKPHDTLYPVKNYYLMVVPDDAKYTFTLDIAEGIYTDTAVSKDVTGDYKAGSFDIKVNLKDLKDVDGNLIKCGDNYVVFVMAVYEDSYKTFINDFSNYLSAPSMTFRLKQKLTQAKGLKFVPEKAEADTKKNVLGTFEFNVNAVWSEHGDYLCMFLPQNNKYVDGLLTGTDLTKLTKEIEQLTTGPAKNYDDIQALKAELVSMEVRLQAATHKNSNNDKATKASKDDKEYIDYCKECIVKLKAKIRKLEKSSKNESKTKEKSVSSGGEPNILFDIKIAENIPPANYIKMDGAGKKPEPSKKVVHFKAEINPETTDCFGNRLILDKPDEQQYFPVVLTVSNKEAELAAQFENQISDLTNQKLIPARKAK